MPQHIYVDTGVLVPLLWDRDPDQEVFCRVLVDDVRGAVKSHGHQVKLPNTVLGELLSTYLRDIENGAVGRAHRPDQTSFLADLYELVEDLEADFEPIPTECHRIARTLSDRDRELGFNDLYIASMAICDAQSTHLLALDNDIIETRAITELARERYDNDRRDHRLSVTNEYD